MREVPREFGSNAVRLTCGEWLVAGFALVLVGALVPRVWLAVERFEAVPDYRLPYRISDDYWTFRRWCRYASRHADVLVLGDSVVWGQYVRRSETLSHYLTDLAEGRTFANLGVDGLHPAAVLGLVKYFGRDIRGRRVILHLNPLWMSSERRDLRVREEVRFNHPRLVPQVFPDLPCYEPSLAEIASVLAERHCEFFGWIRHLRTLYFGSMTLQDWSLEHPYRNPLGQVRLALPLPEDAPKSRPVPWEERGMGKQDFPWVEAEESFQWLSFRKTVRLLLSRRNRVFVVIGPLNAHMLTDASLKRYHSLRRAMEMWFEENGIACWAVPTLPSEYYADASHPLKDGYARVAAELLDAEPFQHWMKQSGEVRRER